MTRHKWWCLMLALGVPSSPGWTAGQPFMADPTRPPPSVLRAMLPPVNPAGGTPAPVMAQAASAAASAASAPKPRAPLPRLTSIRVDVEGGQSVALIDGQALSVGSRIGEWLVTGIDTQGVSLRGARGVHRLALLPATDFGAASVAAPAASGSDKETP